MERALFQANIIHQDVRPGYNTEKRRSIMEGSSTGLMMCGKSHKSMMVILITVVFIFLANLSFAVEPPPRYQIINGSEDKAYLLDTTTGFVWALTYRTIAIGREPVAIPFKFLKICPSSTNRTNFLVEDAKGETCLPASNAK
jgi:hypothetical protein